MLNGDVGDQVMQTPQDSEPEARALGSIATSITLKSAAMGLPADIKQDRLFDVVGPIVASEIKTTLNKVMQKQKV